MGFQCIFEYIVNALLMPHANVERNAEAPMSNAAYVQCPQMQSNFSFLFFFCVVVLLIRVPVLGVLAIWLAWPNVWARTSTSVICRLLAFRHRLVFPLLCAIVGASVFIVSTKECKVIKKRIYWYYDIHHENVWNIQVVFAAKVRPKFLEYSTSHFSENLEK